MRGLWTVLSDYKGFDCRPAKSYKIARGSAVIITDSQGRVRQGPGHRWNADRIVQDLRMESFWKDRRKKESMAAQAAEKKAKLAKKKEERMASASKAKLAGTALRSSTAGVRWLFHLENGGKLRVVSYEEKDGDYVLKLAAGSTTIPAYKVTRIEPVEPKKP